jgi:DNA polymerase III epsilon subunit-like protein
VNWESDDREVFVSVDIEASGQSPAVGSLLSIGACLVDRVDEGIYIELKPLADRGWSDSAEQIHGLSRERLEQDGMDPADAMIRLEEWLDYACAGGRPVFVGFNAPFDWMFVADYFWRYLARNPFGVSALDLKSYYMAAELIPRWDMTRRVHIDDKLGLKPDHSHHALEDAQGQAVLARILLGRNVGSG